MKYFQTWMYVSKFNRIPVIGKYVVKTIQFICGLRGHELSKTEWGYEDMSCDGHFESILTYNRATKLVALINNC